MLKGQIHEEKSKRRMTIGRERTRKNVSWKPRGWGEIHKN